MLQEETRPDYYDVFEPFERLVEIEVAGEAVQVPENNTLLRCFQFLNNEGIAYGDFCWNGDCSNCEVELDGGTDGDDCTGLACRLMVSEGMKITSVSQFVERALRRQG